MSKYLYGASVQGIQEFVFQTNKLKEIIGGSEVVEKICTTIFQETVDKYNEENLIIGAAGNIKYVFDSKTECEALVLKFPKIVMSEAPGITISQSVVEIDDTKNIFEQIDDLETNLRIQRNKPIVQHGLGLMITERSRRTGGAAVGWIKEMAVDGSQLQKKNYAEGNSFYNQKSASNTLMKKMIGSGRILDKKIPFNVGDIVGNKEREWLAIVHADGNNLGKIILKLVDSLKSDTENYSLEKGIKILRDFSRKLDKATTKAAAEAYAFIDAEQSGNAKYPLRPVVLSGDDLTVIIKGDLAMSFTKSFLKNFEEETKSVFSNFCKDHGLKDLDLVQSGMSACAGIAYIKPSYPFHYGVHLSEELCKNAKKIGKLINPINTPSCLSFHKVQSSFTEDYKEIIEKEYKTKGPNLNFGPYFLNKQDDYYTIDDLQEKAVLIQRKDAPQGPIRNWLTMLRIDTEKAKQDFQRIQNLNKKYTDRLSFSDNSKKRGQEFFTPFFDVLTIASIEKKR